MAVSNAEGKLNNALRLGSDAWREQLALNVEAEKRFQTTASQLTIAKNRLTDVRIEIGENLLPAVATMAETVAFAVQGFGDMNRAVKLTIAVLLGLTTALTVASVGGRVVGRVFGTEVAAGLAKASVAARVLQGALGIGLIGALGFVIT